MRSTFTQKLFDRVVLHGMRRLLLIALPLAGLLFGTSDPAWAQTARKTITGTVTDSSGGVMSGVTVQVPGTSSATITDERGKYSIQASSQQTLEFIFVGMATVRQSVGSRNVIDAVMESDAYELEEIVAIGYGSARRADLTGSISSIGTDAIVQSGAMSIDHVLQGRAAGVLMVSNSGMPGGGSSIQIRGLNSINSTNEPIIVIDGVIINAGTGTYTDNAFAGINPNDIESIDILKDASAAAIYGAQGANGVIVLTTKKGREGKARVNVDITYGVQNLERRLDMMNLPDYAYHRNELYNMLGWGITQDFADPSKLGNGTDWQDAIFGPAAKQNYDLSVSGGNNGTTFRLSASYLNQDGVAKGSGFDRMSTSFQINAVVNPWFTIGGRLSFTHTKQVTTISEWSIVGDALKTGPHVPVFNLDGSFGGPEDSMDTFVNPLGMAMLMDRGNRKMNVLPHVYFELKPVNWLSYRMEGSGNLTQTHEHYFRPTYKFGWQENKIIQNDKWSNYNQYWSWKNILTLEKTFASKHRTSLMIGHEVNESTYNNMYGQRTGGSNQLHDLNAGDETTAKVNQYTGRTAFVSVFARLMYNYDDKYLLTATVRRDGSSRFKRGYRWGMFPSASAAWRVSNESFMKNVRLINDLKLRFGYGATGNSYIREFSHTAMLSNTSTIWGTGYISGNIDNPSVSWESQNTINLGLDVTLLNNRINLVVDVYRKVTDDLLMALKLPGYVGTSGTGSASPPYANIGSMENKGFEFTITTTNILKKDFQWTSNLIFSLNRNKVLRLNTENAVLDQTYNGSYGEWIVSRTTEGQSFGNFYGYGWKGRINTAHDIYDENGDRKIAIPENTSIAPGSVWIGDYIWEDRDDNGVINENDRYSMGSPLPKFTGGFGNTISYKNFDLNIQMVYSYGNKLLNFIGIDLENPNRTNNLTRRAGVNYARLGLYDPDGASDDVWNVHVVSGHPDIQRMSKDDNNLNGRRVSTRIMEDGSYLRLQNVSLSYNVPSQWVNRLGLDMIRATVSVDNLITFTKYTGLDPEVGMAKARYGNAGQNAMLNGFDTGRYPTPRVFNFKLSIGF